MFKDKKYLNIALQILFFFGFSSEVVLFILKKNDPGNF